jgi:uncharacterized protein YciI
MEAGLVRKGPLYNRGGSSPAMPLIPFQKLTVVRLVTARNPPPDGPDDDAIHAAHVGYLRRLSAQNIILVNGPFKRIDDESQIRGMGLWLVSPEEARRLISEDPAVKAGWFEARIDEWIFPATPKTIGDRHDLEIDLPE